MKDDLPHQDGRDKRSKGGNAARILDAIKCCHYGEHNMIVYPDTTTLNEVIADHYKEALQERNELVLVIPYYQTVGRVREVLEKNDIDVAKYEHEGSLVIYESVKATRDQRDLLQQCHWLTCLPKERKN